jgi:predicted RecA/RadA family phage recombinase
MAKMKVCSKCGKRKSVDKFFSNSIAKDGLHSQCKECNVESVKISLAKKKELIEEGTFAFPKTKVCSICGKDKKAEDFSVNASTKDGLSSKCKDCYNEKQTAGLKKKKELMEDGSFVFPKTKVCSVCGKRKKAESFNIHVGSKDGLHSKCKKCKAAYEKENYEKKKALKEQED